MRRWLPFLIIFLVALAAVGGGWAFYWNKMHAPAPTRAETGTKPQLPPAQPASDSFHAKGPVNAPVTLEIYGDFQCPACATVTAVVDKVKREYGPKLREIFYEYPLKMHPHAMQAAQAAEAAAEQGHFWEMHDQLYKYQTAWSDATNVAPLFENYAQAIGLDVARFDADLQAQDLVERIRDQATEGDKRGVDVTPTIFINGEHIHGTYTEDRLRAAIDAALAKSNKH